MKISKKEHNTDIFVDIAGGNKILRDSIVHIQELWQKHVNRRTALVIIFVLILGTSAYMFLLRPPNNFPVNTLITIEKGHTLTDIAEKLENDGVIRNAKAMSILSKLYGVDKELHYGDYLFKEKVGTLEIIKRISGGVFGLEPVLIRIREGSTVVKIADTLDQKMLKFNKEKFINIASKQEGYLFPDTYYFLPNAPEEQIVASMIDNFYKQYSEIEQLAESTGYSRHQLVTLASIVELEANNYEDRRKIAGVMYNRLKINMPLQVDVSFVYIMNKGTSEITLEDLKHESPYNTYVYKGLPPGPIGSPSMESLQAVVNPIESDWLFYLADKRGVTHYSKTYKEHLRKKRWYIDRNK